jgi:hypothetical protein
VLLRRLAFHRAEFVVALLLANLPQLAEALEQGSLVVLDENRIRVRRLPISPAKVGALLFFAQRRAHGCRSVTFTLCVSIPWVVSPMQARPVPGSDTCLSPPGT